MSDCAAVCRYRAPELVLQASSYNSPIDMWALACIIAELFLGQPLFPGRSNYDQAVQVLAVAGLPSSDVWPRGMALIGDVRGSFKGIPDDVLRRTQGRACLDLPEELRRRTSSASAFHSRHHAGGSGIPADATALLQKLLVLDPLQRPTAARTLGDAFFADLPCDCAGFLKKVDDNPQLAVEAKKATTGADGLAERHVSPASSSTKQSTLPHRNTLRHSAAASSARAVQRDVLDEAESFIEELEVEPDADFVDQSWDDEVVDSHSQSAVKSETTPQSAVAAAADVENLKPHLDMSNIDPADSDFDNSFDSSDDEVSSLSAPGAALPDAKPVQLPATGGESSNAVVEVPQAVGSQTFVAEVSTSCEDSAVDGTILASPLQQHSSSASTYGINEEVGDCEATQTSSAELTNSVDTEHPQAEVPTSSLRDSEASEEEDSVDLPTITDAAAASVSVDNNSSGFEPSSEAAEGNTTLFRETCHVDSSESEEDAVAKDIPHIADLETLPSVAHSSTASAQAAAIKSLADRLREGQPSAGAWTNKAVPSLPPATSEDKQSTTSASGARTTAETNPSAAAAADSRIAEAIVDATIREHLKKKGALAVLDAYRQWQEELSSAASPTLQQDPGPSFHSRNELFAAAGPRITNYFRREKKRNKNLSILDAVVLANVHKGSDQAAKKKKKKKKTPKTLPKKTKPGAEFS